MTDIVSPDQRSRMMAAIRSKDTKPEMLVRRFLFAKGLRYRINNRNLPGSPDIVLKKYRTVVFVDGCFWHGHPGCKHYREPKTNSDFWRHKIAMNIARDYANGVDLRLAGWRVLRIWECELATKACRDATLEALYRRIIGAEVEQPSESPSIAAEPMVRYGNPEDRNG